MNRRAGQPLRPHGWVTIGFAMAALLGCNVSSNDKLKAVSAPNSPEAASSVQGGDNPGIDLQCAAERIQKPPAPLHWSFKKSVTPGTNADWEADVTPDAIAGTLIDNSGTRAIHGARSDPTSWSTAVMILSGPLPASTFALVNNSSATESTGTETVNGENTVKYAIDTSQDTPTDASLIRTVLGPNGFVKGTAWVTRNGCPVKFILDVEQHNHDGTVDKEHYELNVTKP